jgi:hypothetical protein
LVEQSIQSFEQHCGEELTQFFSVDGLDNQSIAEPAAGLFPNAASDPSVIRR